MATHRTATHEDGPSRSLDVAVLLPTLFSVRNVVYSGLLRHLADAGLRVGLLPKEVPPLAEEATFAAFGSAAACEQLRLPAGTPQRGRALVNGVLASAFARRNGIESYSLYRTWFGRADSSPERLRRVAVDVAGAFAASRPAIGLLSRSAESLYRSAHDLSPIREQLGRLNPRMLWSTTCTSPLEYPYVLAARDLGIPTVASILSFDNLSSRSVLPIFDRYTVWSETMRRELLAYYPEVGPERVVLTGTPQFDFHRREEFRWSRADTLARLGLPAGSRFFLYAASHVSLAPEEPAVIGALADRMQGDPRLADHRLLVRLHPQDDGSRWGGLRDSRRVVLSAACDARAQADGWRLPRPEEQARLIGSLLHADACLNIVSTMSLDAAILDRPVIGLELSGEAASPRGIMYSEYGATHYKPLVASGGMRLARSWSGLLDLMSRAASDPGADRAERAAMVREACGPVDGDNAVRVADAVRRFLGELGSSADSRGAGIPAAGRDPIAARSEAAR
jgi:hypothetical protein